jgi:hypothetical protein
VVEPCDVSCEKPHELVEGGNLGCARARELLANGRELIRAFRRTELVKHALPIALGGGLRSIFMAESPGADRTDVGVSDRPTPSISSRLEAGSVLTSRTRRPRSARQMAVAHASEVLPTPPLPVKNRKGVGASRARNDNMGDRF